MPALSLPIFGFAVGVLLSWSAAGHLRHVERTTQSETIWVAALFGLLIHAPCAAYLLTYSTDWSLGYLLSPRGLPPAALPALGSLNLVVVPLGFLAGASGAKRGQLLRVLQLAAGAISLVLLNTALFWQRLGVNASFIEYQNDFGVRSIAGTALGYALLWIALLLTGSLLWTRRLLRRLPLSVS